MLISTNPINSKLQSSFKKLKFNSKLSQHYYSTSNTFQVIYICNYKYCNSEEIYTYRN